MMGRVEIRFGREEIMEGKVREYDGNGGQRMLFYDGGVKIGNS